MNLQSPECSPSHTSWTLTLLESVLASHTLDLIWDKTDEELEMKVEVMVLLRNRRRMRRRRSRL